MLNRTLTYEVDQITVVLPNEVQDLSIDPDRDYCTLVTCTPYGVNTHRLLVRGKRIENNETEIEEAGRMSQPVLPVIVIIAAVVLLILAIVIPRSRRKRRRRQARTGSRQNQK